MRLIYVAAVVSLTRIGVASGVGVGSRRERAAEALAPFANTWGAPEEARQLEEHLREDAQRREAARELVAEQKAAAEEAARKLAENEKWIAAQEAARKLAEQEKAAEAKAAEAKAAAEAMAAAEIAEKIESGRRLLRSLDNLPNFNKEDQKTRLRLEAEEQERRWLVEAARQAAARQRAVRAGTAIAAVGAVGLAVGAAVWHHTKDPVCPPIVPSCETAAVLLHESTAADTIADAGFGDWGPSDCPYWRPTSETAPCDHFGNGSL